MNIEFYKNSNGKEPVKDFIDSLSSDNKKLLSAKILTVSKLLQKNIVSRELFKKISEDIWEIRFKNIRVFVFRLKPPVRVKNYNMYLLHAIIKKRDDIPKRDFKIFNKNSKRIYFYRRLRRYRIFG